MNPGRVSISVRVSAGAHSSPPQGKRAGEVKALRTGKLGRLLPGVLGWTNCTHADGAHASLEAPVYPGGSRDGIGESRGLGIPIKRRGATIKPGNVLSGILHHLLSPVPSVLFNSPGTDTKFVRVSALVQMSGRLPCSVAGNQRIRFRDEGGKGDQRGSRKAKMNRPRCWRGAIGEGVHETDATIGRPKVENKTNLEQELFHAGRPAQPQQQPEKQNGNET